MTISILGLIVNLLIFAGEYECFRSSNFGRRHMYFKSNFDAFLDIFTNELHLSHDQASDLITEMRSRGFENVQEFLAFSSDFQDRSEILSKVLIEDFGLKALDAHKIRSATTILLSRTAHDHSTHGQVLAPPPRQVSNPLSNYNKTNSTKKNKDQVPFKEFLTGSKSRPLLSQHKDVIHYGLRPDQVSQTLRKELQQFLQFMIEPSSMSQEQPIRKATADVYCRHANQFLGWCINSASDEDINSLKDVFPNTEKQSTESVYRFIKWLKSDRKISVSYEANILRGLTKLAKFRYSLESKADPSYGDKSYEDIPVVRELRKMHREANSRQKTSPRVSDERKKWLPWPEFLAVVSQLKNEAEDLIVNFETAFDHNLLATGKTKCRGVQSPGAADTKKLQVAHALQIYLLLAFFACIPDRQRTMRELEIDSTLLREEIMDDEFDPTGPTYRYIVKHSPDDYKTGRTYGDRPPLVLAPELTAAIDDYLTRWRPALNPQGNHFFVQPRTGAPFTQDSCYQYVARACYRLTGKRTTPHLLRDMVVTHVRETAASEKELEALALYMGHSISMQRSSYDRRTLNQKVAPAVSLLQSLSAAPSRASPATATVLTSAAPSRASPATATVLTPAAPSRASPATAKTLTLKVRKMFRRLKSTDS